MVFISATHSERKLRAFDLGNGQLLWEAELPAAAEATPMTYALNGKQYIVICAGGHGKAGSLQGDYVIAYALQD